MGKGYAVVSYRKIKDPAKWEAYAKLAPLATQKAGGRFLARGMPSRVLGDGAGRDFRIVEGV